MKIFAIADLHLGFGIKDKSMDIFGNHWKNHENKIKEDWLKKVNYNDIVLIAGDISWALKYKEAIAHLKWIESLPGKKILIKGNHDLWWNSIKKLNSEYKNMYFIQNNSFVFDDIAFVGTRGWDIPGYHKFNEHDEKIYKREALRLENSINSLKDNNYNKIIAMMHYPPIMKWNKKTNFVNILNNSNTKAVIYGHLHDSVSWNNIVEKHLGINYILTSADYLDFKLIEIKP